MSRVHLAVIAVGLAASSSARALQPLEDFIAAAHGQNPDARAARANVVVQEAQGDVALGRVLPGLSLQANYIRHQYQVELPLAPPVIQARYNEVSGNATLTVPLLDLANFAQVAAARANAESSARTLEQTVLDVESRTAQDYYQLLANLVLAEVAERYLAVSRENLRITEAKLKAGAATRLEVDRALADVESQVQQLANARLQVALSARDLESATSLSPVLSGSVELADDLHQEPPLEQFEAETPGVPSVTAAAAASRAAGKRADAQRLALVPSLSGSFTETGTNTPVFQPSHWYWQATVALSWNLDLTVLANIRSADGSLAVAEAQETKTTLSAGDAIHRYWNTVTAYIAQSRSARAGRDASVEAADRARVQYQAGTATQLDLLQAQRDAFAAEVTRIQYDANLLNARAQLRLSTGHGLGR